MTTYQEVKTLMSLITPYSLPEDDESAFHTHTHTHMMFMYTQKKS